MTTEDSIKKLDLTQSENGTDEPPKPFRFEPQYETGKSICGFISLLGWIAVVAGFALAYMVVIGAANQYGAVDYSVTIPAFAIVLGGFLNVALGQIGKAIIDNTNANLERLALIKWQLGNKAS